MSSIRPLIEVKQLKKYFPVWTGSVRRTRQWVQAVDDVSFSILPGTTLGLVGESGCGKTTLGRLILNLIKPGSGSVLFDGVDIYSLQAAELRAMRRNMQIIFQDPYASLDPRRSVGDSILSGLEIHKIGDRNQRQASMLAMLQKVGLEPYHANRYPHEFSGGQRQRIGIARALALQPRFLVCDEPVSALDVSIQSQVLNILKDLQAEFNLTYLFIAHNMSVVEHISDQVAVMYLGRLAEWADREDLFGDPLHPYTQALISAIPIPNPSQKRNRTILKGDVPSPLNPPAGCRFHPRCPVAKPVCSQSVPEFKEVKPNHRVACWLYDS